jgi:cation:H+ antiporter
MNLLLFIAGLAALVLGANLLVRGASRLALSFGVAPQVMAFEIWVMVATAMACLPIFISGREIARWEGGLFLAYYAAYAAWLILSAMHSGVLPAYASVMMSFVLPLTLVTLVVMIVHRPPRK